MDYFEASVPEGDGYCSDMECPCPDTVIPRGSGYMYISNEIVEFRKKYPKLADAKKAVEDYLNKNFPGVPIVASVPVSILVCELGARRRNLDLEVAAADAEYWWETGLVPLRVTPTASKS